LFSGSTHEKCEVSFQCNFYHETPEKGLGVWPLVSVCQRRLLGHMLGCYLFPVYLGSSNSLYLVYRLLHVLLQVWYDYFESNKLSVVARMGKMGRGTLGIGDVETLMEGEGIFFICVLVQPGKKTGSFLFKLRPHQRFLE